MFVRISGLRFMESFPYDGRELFFFLEYSENAKEKLEIKKNANKNFDVKTLLFRHPSSVFEASRTSCCFGSRNIYKMTFTNKLILEK